MASNLGWSEFDEEMLETVRQHLRKEPKHTAVHMRLVYGFRISQGLAAIRELQRRGLMTWNLPETKWDVR